MNRIISGMLLLLFFQANTIFCSGEVETRRVERAKGILTLCSVTNRKIIYRNIYTDSGTKEKIIYYPQKGLYKLTATAFDKGKRSPMDQFIKKRYAVMKAVCEEDKILEQ